MALGLYIIFFICTLVGRFQSTYEAADTDEEVETFNEIGKGIKPDVLTSTIEDEGGGVEPNSENTLSGKTITEVKIFPNGSAVPLGNEHWDKLVQTLLTQKIKDGLQKNNYNKTKAEIQKYTCIKCDEYKCQNTNVCYDSSQCYKARQRDSTGTETYSRGCIEKVEQIEFVCSSSYQKQVEALVIECCQGNLCNNGSYPELPHPSADPLSDNGLELLKLAVYIIFGTLVFVVLISALIYFVATRYIFKQKNLYLKSLAKRSGLNPFSDTCRNGNKFVSSEDSALRSMLNESVSSGSGSGQPLFVQRTLAKNIYLEDIVGKGRFSEVWKGMWHGEPVAVKIFFSRDEAYWAREIEIYSVLLRHDNILCFYGSDRTCRASCTQLWLVAHYLPNGSLHDYLRMRVLNHVELFTICLSIVNGLLHLHTEINGTQGKPAIAHRDLNSNNVLVKEDGTCCISDFGLAVIRTPGTEEIDLGSNERCGTRRYMSPEILEGSIDLENFESFRKADIYAVALVMWEASQRCLCNGIAEGYSRPYEDYFPSDPPLEEFQKLVCVHKVRPPIPSRWTDDKVLSSMDRILNECWHPNPNVRLTALRIKKNLLKIFSEEMINETYKEGHKVV